MTTSEDDLFGRWEQRYRDTLFVRDGIIENSAWRMAPKRIVFLLKEYNATPSLNSKPPTGDFRLECNEKPWTEIGRWAYGLLHLSSNPTFQQANDSFKSACRSVAIVNLKKTAGGNCSCSDEIAEYARRDRDLLQEQMAILNPHIVVCCGKKQVFSLATELFEDAATAKEIVSLTQGRVLEGQATMWVDYVHPSMRHWSREEKYWRLIELGMATNGAFQRTR